ncbi:MAG: hypothetical protein AB2L12_14795 [Smithellaceae bacterium]
MKKIKNAATNIFLIALGLTFLASCAFFDQQTKKEPEKAPAISEEQKPKQVIKATPKKAPVAADEKYHEHKAVPQKPADKTPSTEPSSQQKYYDMGMRYYSQEKYTEAKKAWQRVIKLGKRTALADKARENIKKVDQILKTLKEMSGQ